MTFLLLQMEIPLESVVYAAKRAKSLGKTVILNPAPVPENFPEELFQYADYLTPNEVELFKLANMKAGGSMAGGSPSGEKASEKRSKSVAGDSRRQRGALFRQE